MYKSSLPQGVRTLMGWRDKGVLTFDNPVQRAGSQWNSLQKSLLIQSILANFPIPTVYFLKSKNEENVTIYDVLDAKQRLTSVFEFIDGEYALDEDTPEVTVEGTPYDLAGMKFEDLSEECQDIIKGYRFSICCIEDATEEEVEDIFARLNNATPLSTIQKCRSVMGTDLARWTKEMCNHGFFKYAISLTKAQIRREADLEVLLQAMLLLDSRHEGYEWKSISVAEVTKYCRHIRGKYNDDKRRMVEEILDYLFSAFTEPHKFLKKSNIPTVMCLAKVALENNVSADDFAGFIDVFAEGLSEEYKEGMGSGNIKHAKTEIRLKAIAKDFRDFMEINLDESNILSVLGGTSDTTEESSVETADEPPTTDQDETIENESVNSEDSGSSENNELIDEPISSDESAEELEENSGEESKNTTEEEGVEDVSGEDSSVQIAS